MSTLIVTLPPEPASAGTLFEYLLTQDGSTVSQQARVPAALLPASAAIGGEVVALVPAQHLSWQPVQLPQGTLARGLFQDGGAARVRAVLDGLLEDRLLDEPSHLHFALAPQPQADAPVWVAVCDRSWLQAGLQVLEQAGLRVNRIVPELAPDLLADTLYVMGEPDQAHLVALVRDGVAVWPVSPASVALLQWPEGQRVVAEPAVAELAEELFKRTVTLQQGAQRQLQALQSSWDLAQFDLVTSRGARHWKHWGGLVRTFWRAPRWRPARLALLAVLVVNVAGLNAWAWKEKAGLNAQRQAARDVLTRTFPKVQVVVDAPIQMARELALLQQASGAPSGRDLETMLGVFSAVAPVHSAPEAIEFVAGELRLKGLKLSPEALADLAFKLKPQGYGATGEGDNLVIKQGAGV